jgi:predicted N-acetyltransferase YhbS
MHKISLRLEQPSDYHTVEKITCQAFSTAPSASKDEALLAHKLRNIPVFVPELDYVAEIDGKVVGNIMYTRSKVVSDHTDQPAEWETLTFGPVSVLPEVQRRGVGSALIRHTLNAARGMGFRAVLIFGHPAYYPRFGFVNAEKYGITTEDGQNFDAFMALPLYDGALDGVTGRLICDPVYVSLDKAEANAFNLQFQVPGPGTDHPSAGGENK